MAVKTTTRNSPALALLKPGRRGGRVEVNDEVMRRQREKGVVDSDLGICHNGSRGGQFQNIASMEVRSKVMEIR